MITIKGKEFLSPSEVSKLLGVSTSALRSWRVKTQNGKPCGPEFIKIGTFAKYKKESVEQFLEGLGIE